MEVSNFTSRSEQAKEDESTRRQNHESNLSYTQSKRPNNISAAGRAEATMKVSLKKNIERINEEEAPKMTNFFESKSATSFMRRQIVLFRSISKSGMPNTQSRITKSDCDSSGSREYSGPMDQHPSTPCTSSSEEQYNRRTHPDSTFRAVSSLMDAMQNNLEE